MTVSELLIALMAIFAAAKRFGEIAERIGQPAVLGREDRGIVIGGSGLRLADAHEPILLIGLETDVRRLLAAGGASATVATTGVQSISCGGRTS